MFSPLNFLPKSWKTDALIIRNGGRDNKGNPKPDTEIPITGFLIAPRATSDPVDQSDVVAATVVGYHASFGFQSTDRIRIPAGKRMAGDWSIDGLPKEWPHGSELPLKRA